jgi:hypothetical protein
MSALSGAGESTYKPSIAVLLQNIKGIGAEADVAAGRRWACAAEALPRLDLLVLLGQTKRTRKDEMRTISGAKEQGKTPEAFHSNKSS